MPAVTFDEAKATLDALCKFTNEDSYVLASGPIIIEALDLPNMTSAELVKRILTLEFLSAFRPTTSPRKVGFRIVTLNMAYNACIK